MEDILNELCRASGREPDQNTTSGYIAALEANNGSQEEILPGIIDPNVARRIAELEASRGSLLYGPRLQQDLSMKWLKALRGLLSAHCSGLGDRADRLPKETFTNPFQGHAAAAGMVLREPGDFLLEVLRRLSSSSSAAAPLSAACSSS